MARKVEASGASSSTTITYDDAPSKPEVLRMTLRASDKSYKERL